MVRKALIIPLALLLLFVLLGAIAYALTLGPAGISVHKTIQILLSGSSYTPTEKFSLAHHTIIWNLRFPRTLTAVVAGAILSVAGMVYQALFRNPMADPYVLGISSGAAFGVAFASFVGFISGATGVWQLPLTAFLGSFGTALVIMILSGGTRRSPTTLLLTGIALNFFLSALMTLFMYLNRAQLQSIMQWTLGSFASASWSKLAILCGAALITIIPLLFFTRELDILLLDEASASSLGVSVKKVRLILLLLSTFATSITVAFCGVIGFVGLMIPHMFRLITGPRHRLLLLFSLLGGSLMAVLSDMIARTAVAPSELPVGVITALAGTPLFFFLLIQHRRSQQ